MEFRIQDILKNIIPGSLFLILILVGNIISNILSFPEKVPESVKDLSAIAVLIVLAITYTLGYFLDSLSSLIERNCLYRWVSKPSFKLLNGKNNAYRLDNRQQIIKFLCDNSSVAVPNVITKEFASSLFNKANFLKDKNPSDIFKEKVSEYYNAYIFSRNIMTVVFISLVYNLALLLSTDMNDKSMLAAYCSTLGVLLALSIIRWRSNAYYYSRLIFYAAFKL